jgi:glycosyltransferase involved in cell wall biosynthesis
MPTRGRRELAAKAVDYFWSQTYQNKQLLILDDEEDLSFTVKPQAGRSHVFYARRSDPMTIGAKRNTLCAMAGGPIIAHWDSDDYSAPTRLAEQYRLLEDSGKAVTAFHSLIFVDEAARVAAMYTGDPDDVVGTSLMYRRDWWVDHPFDDISMQEDCRFGRYAYRCGQLHSIKETQALMVARTHDDITSTTRRMMIGENWKTLAYDSVCIP